MVRVLRSKSMDGYLQVLLAYAYSEPMPILIRGVHEARAIPLPEIPLNELASVSQRGIETVRRSCLALGGVRLQDMSTIWKGGDALMRRSN